MSAPLNVVALISGGKDSLFSILHCLENGHKVVALANLYPRNTNADEEPSHTRDDSEGDDLNSFMYQTVGHSIIPLYAECLDIPLYRREITGSAVQTGRYYEASNLDSTTDETEDMVPLLQDVLKVHPEVNALCSGAILSTYQRTRVESVAIRLGLIPLAYLWQYPALPPPVGRSESLTGLLDDMGAAGCDARIIKIASGGIKESLLWANVADPKTQLRLVNGLRPFFSDHEFWLRGAVLGEGGEYETLAINGPRRLWKRRIEVFEDQISSSTVEGGVHYLRFAKARAVENQPDTPEIEAMTLRRPQAFDPQFQTAFTMVRGHAISICGDSTDSGRLQPLLIDLLQPAYILKSDHMSISNITAQEVTSTGSVNTAAAQMEQICDKLTSLLRSLPASFKLSQPLTTSNIVATTLLLKDMSNFGAINPIYAALFQPGEPNPPARVTIACSLPQNVEISLNVLLHLGLRDTRRGLHVQSRSYWAPANIGPYSQAICVPLNDNPSQIANLHDGEIIEMVHMAGQIPLKPFNMELSQTDLGFLEQAGLSLQHLWRIGQERGVDAWPWGIAFLSQADETMLRAELSCRMWQQAHLAGTRPAANDPDEVEVEGYPDEGPDAWDLQYNHAAQWRDWGETNIGQHLKLLPDPAVLKLDGLSTTFTPAFIVAEVTALPRNAPIEWWSMGIANLSKSPNATTRILATQKDFTWGSASKVTVLSTKAVKLIHLITLLVHQSSESANPMANIPTLEKDVTDFVSRVDDSGEAASMLPEVVHGTAFISLQNQHDWTEFQRYQLFKNLVITPCNSLYGTSYTVTNSTSRSAPASNSGHVGMFSQPLSIAVTIRFDAAASTYG